MLAGKIICWESECLGQKDRRTKAEWEVNVSFALKNYNRKANLFSKMKETACVCELETQIHFEFFTCNNCVAQSCTGLRDHYLATHLRI